MAKVAITWRKSAIGYNQRQKDTIRKLGLRRLNQTVEHDDSPTLRGMIARVGHLIDVRDEAAGESS